MVDPVKHAEFHERQQSAMNAVLVHASACGPRGWRTATLQLDAAFSPFSNKRSIRHQLHNPDSNMQVTAFSEALFQATTALHTVFAQYQEAWVRATLTMTFDTAGRLCGSVTKYYYGHGAHG